MPGGACCRQRRRGHFSKPLISRAEECWHETCSGGPLRRFGRTAAIAARNARERAAAVRSRGDHRCITVRWSAWPARWRLSASSTWSPTTSPISTPPPSSPRRSLFEEFLVPGARDTSFAGADAGVHSVLDRAAFHDFGQGPIQRTGNPLDIALDGDAFIAVQRAGGERYTRDGALQINAAGQLVTPDGDTVAGDSGPIISRRPITTSPISADGRITVIEGTNTAETLRGQIKLVSFAQPQQPTAGGREPVRGAGRGRRASRHQRARPPGRHRGLQRQRRARNDANDRDQPDLFADRLAAPVAGRRASQLGRQTRRKSRIDGH